MGTSIVDILWRKTHAFVALGDECHCHIIIVITNINSLSELRRSERLGRLKDTASMESSSDQRYYYHALTIVIVNGLGCKINNKFSINCEAPRTVPTSPPELNLESYYSGSPAPSDTIVEAARNK